MTLSACRAAGNLAGTLLVDPVAVDGEVVIDAYWPGLEAGRLHELRCQLAVVPGSHAVLWDALAETGALVRDFVTERIRA